MGRPVTPSPGMLTHDFYFQNFFPKNLAKKLGRVLQPEISGMVCVRVRFCSTPPPFRADEKYPRGSFPRGGFPGAAFGTRDRSLVDRRLATSFMSRDGRALRCLSLILLRNL